MRLYHSPLSPNCAMVRVVALRLGQPLELRLVDLRAGEQHAPEFLKLNPNGKVPTLTDGDYALWETSAIMQYIASKEPNTLWPSERKARIEVNKWMAWCQCHFTPATIPYVFQRVFKKLRGMGEPDLEAIEKADVDFHKYAKVLEDALTGRAFLVGTTLTLADLMIAAGLLIYAEKSQIPLEGYPNILRLMGTVGALPEWREATQETFEVLKSVA